MRNLIVDPDEGGQRLDKFLKRRLPLASSSFIYKMLRKKNITLRGKKADGSDKVREGDCVALFLSEETIAKFSSHQDENMMRQREGEERRAFRMLSPLLGQSPVLYEDENVLLVCKPAGVLSQKADPTDCSMNEWLREYLRREGCSSVPGFSPSVCNRLDRNTGGILFCSKSLRGSRVLSSLIRERRIRKTYRMVVHGRITEPGVIDTELVKDRRHNQVFTADRQSEDRNRSNTNSRTHSQEESSRRAVTVYRPVSTGSRTTLVEADLITGRSHQLRVHMASMGHPIVGDPRYGDRGKDAHLFSLIQEDARSARGPGQLLWCVEAEFPPAENIPGTEEILLPLSGRIFTCQEPSWWKKLCI